MKPSRHLKRLLKNESAQALVETVIVLPVVIFFILGTIQLTLMHQARLMLEYAAFNAARTGSVWNGDVDKMRNAAMISLIASRPQWPGVGNFNMGMIDDYLDVAGYAAAMVGINAVADNLNLSLVRVDVLSPVEADFGDSEEIDFDQTSSSFEDRRKTQLTIRLTYFYEMVIPFANMVIWNSWWQMRCTGMGNAARFLNAVNTVMEYVTGENPGLGVGRGSPFLAFRYIEYNALGDFLGQLFSSGFMSTEDRYEGMSAWDWGKVWVAAEGTKDFFIPLVTAHTIRMQSNPYKKFAGENPRNNSGS